MTHAKMRRTVRCAVALLAVAATVAACGDDASSGPPFTVGSTPPPAVAGIATNDARIDAAVAQLPDLAQKLLARSGVPGLAVGVVHDGKVVYTGAFGVKDNRKPDDKVDVNTVFQIASLSKAISATVVAGQVGKHDVEWTMPVTAGLDWFALADPYVTSHVTLGDMFSHRSGLPDHAGDDLEDIGFDRAEILRRLRYLSLDPFRTQELYTNFGLTAAATAVAAKAGTDWETLSTDTLFTPLGMSSTTSRYDEFLRERNRAVLHAKVDGKFAPLYQRIPDAQAPAGGVNSNVTDLTKWLTLILANGKFDGRQIVNAEALQAAMTPQLSLPSGRTDFRPAATGFGFNISTDPSGRATLSHSGAFELGAATNFQLIPSLKLGIVVLTNGAPVGVPEVLAKDFTDLAQYGALTADWASEFDKLLPPTQPEGELVGKKPPANATAAKPLTDYVGTYANDYFGPLTIAANGPALKLSIGPKNETFDLTHFDGDTFTLRPRGEGSTEGSISQVRFTLDGGRASSVWIEFWDENGKGTWRR